jgi:hypothetical protein
MIPIVKQSNYGRKNFAKMTDQYREEAGSIGTHRYGGYTDSRSGRSVNISVAEMC